MSDYKLSDQAEIDLLAIYASTEEKFGKYQADAYHAGLERIFGLLAEFPLMGISADELDERGCAAFGFNRIIFSTWETPTSRLSVHLFMSK